MHATTLLLVPAAALALGVRGASMHRPRQNDPHIVDFRTFGLPGCYEQNQGVYTYLQSDLGTCFPFSTTDVVESLFVTDINAGCSGEFFLVSNRLFHLGPLCSMRHSSSPTGSDERRREGEVGPGGGGAADK